VDRVGALGLAPFSHSRLAAGNRRDRGLHSVEGDIMSKADRMERDARIYYSLGTVIGLLSIASLLGTEAGTKALGFLALLVNGFVEAFANSPFVPM
jgi:hypothetical protein